MTFSGSFTFTGMDYLGEGSITEAGSMTDPEFIFSFSKLEPVDTSKLVAMSTTPPDEQPVSTEPPQPDQEAHPTDGRRNSGTVANALTVRDAAQRLCFNARRGAAGDLSICYDPCGEEYRRVLKMWLKTDNLENACNVLKANESR